MIEAGSQATARPVRCPPWARVAIAVLVVASLLPRLARIADPLVDHPTHAFRQTQTAVTIDYMARGEFSMLRYPLPVVGPPWVAPMEFPIYQASAALLVMAGVDNVDVAGRLASMVWFYMSALVLWRLVGLWLDRAATAAIVLFYLWSPFTIYWSRTCMIETTAVFFAVAYVYAVARYLGHGRRGFWLVAGCLAGSGVFLAKITTAFPASILIALLVIRRFDREWAARRRARGVGVWRWVGIAALAVVPLVVGVSWTRYADRVKSEAGVEGLVSTSPGMIEWNFGTWEQRERWPLWRIQRDRIVGQITPGGLWMFAVLACAVALLRGGITGLLIVGSLAAAFLTILLFFNLYWRHDYYLVALTPWMAIAVGFGIACVWHWMGRLQRWRPGAFAAMLLGCLIAARSSQTWLWHLRDTSEAMRRDWRLRLADLIARATPPNEPVIMTTYYSWEPTVLYYARRRGLMCGFWESTPDGVVPDSVRAAGYKTLACRPDQSRFLAWFPNRTYVGEVEGYVVYRIEDDRGSGIGGDGSGE